MEKDVVVAPNDLIDLQLHTVLSDGTWTPEALLDYLVAEGFRVAAITDHDRADTQSELQALAQARDFHLLRAVEISSMYEGQLTDFLCFGFEPEGGALETLTNEVHQRQTEMTTLVVNGLRQRGLPVTDDELSTILAKTAVKHVDGLVSLVQKYYQGDEPLGKLLLEAGFAYVTTPPAEVVAAAHASDALCILAHPGRSDGFFCFDPESLDALRQETPIDGIEVYYPLHSPEQTQQFLAYATTHDLLISAGSDSHHPEKPPIKYRAELCRNLLERLGIQVS